MIKNGRCITLALIVAMSLGGFSLLFAQKKEKETYAIFSLEEPKLVKKPGDKPKVRKFPLPPGAKRTDNAKEEVRDNIGELQVYYVDMDIVKVREFYSKQLGTEGRVNKGNPLVGAGGSVITIPVEEGFTHPTTGKKYPDLLLYGAKLTWHTDKAGNSQTRIMVQMIKDKKVMAEDLVAREKFMATEGQPKHIPQKGEIIEKKQ